MSVLAGCALLLLSFGVFAVSLFALQTWVRLLVAPKSSERNIEVCVRIALVVGAWFPYVAWNHWYDHNSVWVSLQDQRLLFAGGGISLMVVGATSVLQNWAYAIRSWLLAANCFAAGLFGGVFVASAVWPGSFETFAWFLGPMVWFGGTIYYILRSKPADPAKVRSSGIVGPNGSGSRTA